MVHPSSGSRMVVVPFGAFTLWFAIVPITAMAPASMSLLHFTNIHTSAWIQFILHTSPTWCSHLVPCVLVTSRFVPGQCCWTHLDISHLTWPWLQPGFLPPTLLISFGAFTALPAVEARNLGTILDSFLSPSTSKPLDGISFHLSLQNIFWVFLFVCLSCFCFSTCNFMLEYRCVTVLW